MQAPRTRLVPSLDICQSLWTFVKRSGSLSFAELCDASCLSEELLLDDCVWQGIHPLDVWQGMHPSGVSQGINALGVGQGIHPFDRLLYFVIRLVMSGLTWVQPIK